MTTTAGTSTRLHPPWLNITRALWIILTTASLLAFVAATVISFNEPLPSCVDPDVPCGPWMVTREDLDLAQLVALAAVATMLPQLGLGVTSSLYALSLLVTFLLWFLAAGYSSIYRYKRVSSPTERQQSKWVLAGILGTFLLFIPFTIASIWFPPAEPKPERLAFMFLVFIPFYVVSYLAIPVGIAFAILRYRLWDIDVIVRKTLVYAVLTALLALVFFGIVSLLTSLFSAVSGQQSALAIVVSTLAIAALFNPLRRRVQNGIDRQFFRKKYDAQKVLAQFALTARDETDLDALTAELVRVLQETMQPERVSVWLQETKSPTGS